MGNFIYLFIFACAGTLSLGGLFAVLQSYSPVAVRGLLVSLASPVVKRGLHSVAPEL